MKKFNLQEALTGMPVVTRTGKPITKIWYNKEADENGYPFPIIAWSENNTEYHSYTKNGKYLEEEDDSGFDLFMLANENDEAREEAKRLISQFFAIAPQPYTEKEVDGLKFEEWDKYWTLNFAKEAALITVKEIMSFMRKDDIENQCIYWANHKKYEFYSDVKIEILKYK